MSVAEIRSTPFSPSGGFEHLSFGNAPSEILHSFLLKYLKGRDIAAFGLSNKFLFQHVFYDVRIYKRLFQDFFPILLQKPVFLRVQLWEKRMPL